MRGIGTTQAAPKRTATANGKAALVVTGRAERRTATVNGKAVLVVPPVDGSGR